MEPTVRYRAAFPCSCAGISKARGAIKQFAADRLSGDDLSDFEVAAGEALANALEHGRGPEIRVECRVENGGVIVEIAESGPGFFPPGDVRPPPAGAQRGYGLFIMHNMTDAVEFLDGGRRIRLSKSPQQKR